MTKFVFMDKFRWTQNLIIFENLSFPEKSYFYQKSKVTKCLMRWKVDVQATL